MDIDQLRKHFAYNSETGELTFLRDNRVATSKDKDGYIRVGYKRKRLQAHRVAWMLHHNEDPGEMQIDHINRIRDDNSINNLRKATHQQNHGNVKGKGIQRKGNRWKAYVTHQGRMQHIGSYICPLIARIAYEDKKLELCGEFAPK